MKSRSPSTFFMLMLGAACLMKAGYSEAAPDDSVPLSKMDRLWCPEKPVNFDDTTPRFASGSAAMTAQGKCAVRNMVAVLGRDYFKRNENRAKFELVGHADKCLGNEADLALSRERALLVEAWLLRGGLDPDLIERVRWMGSTRTLLDKPSNCDQPFNDRVEFNLLTIGGRKAY